MSNTKRKLEFFFDCSSPWTYLAFKEIDLDLFSTWGDGERIAVNVNSLYREYKGEEKREEITLLFEQMAELKSIDE